MDLRLSETKIKEMPPEEETSDDEEIMPEQTSTENLLGLIWEKEIEKLQIKNGGKFNDEYFKLIGPKETAKWLRMINKSMEGIQETLDEEDNKESKTCLACGTNFEVWIGDDDAKWCSDECESSRAPEDIMIVYKRIQEWLLAQKLNSFGTVSIDWDGKDPRIKIGLDTSQTNWQRDRSKIMEQFRETILLSDFTSPPSFESKR
jgi:hypothetical protein